MIFFFFFAHLCQVSPVRGAGAPPGAAGTPSSPHDSCARPHRLRWPPVRARQRSKRVRRTSREGIFLGTSLHLPAGSFSLWCDRLLSLGSKPGDSVSSGRHRGFKHLTKRFDSHFKIKIKITLCEQGQDKLSLEALFL